MSEWRNLGEIAETNPETLSSDTELGYRFKYIDLGSVKEGNLLWNNLQEFSLLDAPSRARRKVRPGDSLFGTVRPNLRSHGYIDNHNEGDLVASTGFSVIRARRSISDGRYLSHVILSEGVYAQSVNQAVGSNYPAVNDRDVKGFKVYAPPIEEQKAIANILDTLDTQIRQTEAIVAKLQQVKRGLLHDLLTRGIDANGQLRPPRDQAPELYKESPLRWIPREWEVRLASSICAQIIDCKNRTPPETADGYAVIKTWNIKNGKLLENSLSFTDKASYEIWTARGKPRAGDVVITREAPVGESFVITEAMPNMCLGQRIMLYRPNPELVRSNFLHASIMFELTQRRLTDAAGGSTVGHVRVGDIRDFKFVIPPVEEQTKIEDRACELDSRINLEIQTREKLKKQKSGLMDDLLTGRVRVTSLLDTAKAS